MKILKKIKKDNEKLIQCCRLLPDGLISVTPLSYTFTMDIWDNSHIVRKERKEKIDKIYENIKHRCTNK